MYTDCQRLPNDVTEIIVDFASYRNLQNPHENSDSKHTLLACALVCRSWLSHARRRLESLCFKSGIVNICLKSQEFEVFRDIFRSPLCTLDPSFIKSLEIKDGPGDENIFPFFTLLSIIAAFPSLDTLRFQEVCPSFSEGEDDTSSPPFPAPFPQVKNLTFSVHFYDSSPLGIIAKTCHFFPYLESLTVYGADCGGQYQSENLSALSQFRPAHSLRKLVVDTTSFVSLFGWLAACHHTNFSSLSIQDDQYTEPNEIKQLYPFLDAVAHSLEDFQLSLYSVPLASIQSDFIWFSIRQADLLQQPRIRLHQRYLSQAACCWIDDKNYHRFSSSPS